MPESRKVAKMPEENEIEESSDIASENEYDEAENSTHEPDDEMNVNEHPHDDGDGAVQAKKPKLDPKDPLRPRRKKARRACFACQRAHLTCGMLRLCLFHNTVPSTFACFVLLVLISDLLLVLFSNFIVTIHVKTDV